MARSSTDAGGTGGASSRTLSWPHGAGRAARPPPAALRLGMGAGGALAGRDRRHVGRPRGADARRLVDLATGARVAPEPAGPRTVHRGARLPRRGGCASWPTSPSTGSWVCWRRGRGGSGAARRAAAVGRGLAFVAGRVGSVAAVAFCAGVAILDELHQRTLPSRTGSARDVLIDVAGATAGVVVAALVGAGGDPEAARALTGPVRARA